MKTIVGGIRDFIKNECPCLDEFYKGIGVDLLGEEAGSYAIETVPVDPIIKQYIDGSSERRFSFNFISKKWYGTDAIENIENIGFFDAFSEWLDECTENQCFPVVPDGYKVRKIFATTTPYLFDDEADVARYQIQCQMNYFKPRRN
ncbi:chloramphenicol resistance protein [Eubacterium sp.]|uniref:chloramphenicol resistance protein n=1 Tax=Eubacterium sp. TaxID=142586 RepID=UPI002FC69469